MTRGTTHRVDVHVERRCLNTGCLNTECLKRAGWRAVARPLDACVESRPHDEILVVVVLRAHSNESMNDKCIFLV